MVYFYTKNPNLGIFWRAFEWQMFCIFYDHFEYFTEILVYFKAIWYSL
jgi:hypothetical protein